jgi:outer membrane protein assembly factor BamE (lipoprotein component of BamABCDE complex)
MQSTFNSRTSRTLLAAGLLFGVAAAQAATGFTVGQQDEAQIKVGMDAASVQQALGQPERVMRYGNEPGPTWEYRVQGSNATLFEVDFSADGKVASVDQRDINFNSN